MKWGGGGWMGGGGGRYERRGGEEGRMKGKVTIRRHTSTRNNSDTVYVMLMRLGGE